MPEKWYEKNLRRLMVDMHIPDWNEEMLRDFSPEKYAEMMALADTTTAEIAAVSCMGLCHWPTRVGFPHKNLNGRDLLGETIEACRKRGIEIQLYLNIWNRAAYDAHPDWRTMNPDGKGSVESGIWGGRYGWCCHNTPYGKFFLDLLDELCSRYECRGYWIDMFSEYTICRCPACRERFRIETGYEEYPAEIDWNDPRFIALQKCRERWLAEFVRKIRDTIRKRHPERTLTFQSAGLGCWVPAMTRPLILDYDFMAADFGEFDSVILSMMCKLFSAFSANRPIELMVPRCESLAQHTAERSPDSLLLRVFTCLLHQASFTMIDAIDPSGTLDRRFYEHAGKANRRYAEYEKYIRGQSVPVADIAVYVNTDSQVDTDKKVPLRDFAESKSKHFFSWCSLVGLCEKEHLLCCFTGDCTKLASYPVVILSDVSRMTDTECTAFEKYVQNGGKLYASYCTSLYDPEKGMRKDFGLAGTLGIHYADGKTLQPSYISPTEESPLNRFCTRKYPVMLEHRQVKILTDRDVEVLGTGTFPCSSAEETTRFGSANSNPPMTWTDSPALVHRRSGKGEILYCAGKLEEAAFDLPHRIFTALLRKLNPERVIETDAPGTVTFTVFDQPGENRYIISLLNLSFDSHAQPWRDIHVKLRLPLKKYRVSSLSHAPDEKEVPWTFHGDLLEFTIPELKNFAMFLLKYTSDVPMNGNREKIRRET